MQRQELLSGAAIPALLRKPGTESEMVSTAADITAGLRRAKMALAEQIQHTEGNTTLLGKAESSPFWIAHRCALGNHQNCLIRDICFEVTRKYLELP